MIYAHHTATGPDATSHVYTGAVREAIIQVNAALTGTITISDETATASTPVVAVITNPTVGTRYVYRGLTKGLTVVPSTTCDITTSADISFSGK